MRPAQSFTRWLGWKMPCTASCSSENKVLLTKEKAMAAGDKFVIFEIAPDAGQRAAAPADSTSKRAPQ